MRSKCFCVKYTFAELVDRRCVVSAAWIGSAGGLARCYDDSELDHPSRHPSSK